MAILHVHGKQGLLCEKIKVLKSRFIFLPNYTILDLIKLKASVDEKTDVATQIISIFDKVENIMGKGENIGHKQVILFPYHFQKATLRVKENERFRPMAASADCAG